MSPRRVAERLPDEPVEDVVADRLGKARDLVEKISEGLKAYGDTTTAPKWDEAGTLGYVVFDLEQIADAVEALLR